jgi:hypothetical protein
MKKITLSAFSIFAMATTVNANEKAYTHQNTQEHKNK